MESGAATAGVSQNSAHYMRFRGGEEQSDHAQMGARIVQRDNNQEAPGYLAQAAEIFIDFCSRGVSILKRTVSIVTSPIIWMVENRLGLAKLVGKWVVPSQFICPDFNESERGIDRACTQTFLDYSTERVLIENGPVTLNAVIHYPAGWNTTDKSRCILFHNPNGMVISQYFKGIGSMFDYCVPEQLLQLRQCPVILYDYRGTGINGDKRTAPHATCETVSQDGLAATKYALEHFDSVEVVGSSLGGGVAAEGLSRYCASQGDDFNPNRVKLISHDSFTTTPRVIMPNWPRLADTIGWLVGGYLGAESAMRKLIDRGVAVKVLNHIVDPVIPVGARMSEFANTQSGNLSVFESPYLGHGILTNDMKDKLR